MKKFIKKKNLFNLLKENLLFIFLVLFSLGIFVVAWRINLFRYNNFDFGKFDLGNMAQMVWNTLHGRLLYLTDYFGTNLPRWSMSHVDPILLVFVPIFAIFPHSLTLVYSQVLLIILSSLVIYKIAELELDNKVSALMFGLSYLFYPAVGFLIAWTGFHGVSAVMPFFLIAFYIYENMFKNNNFTKKGYVYFWIFLVLTMMGKEQLPLYVSLLGVFIALFRFKEKINFPKKGKVFKWLKSLWGYSNVRVGFSMFVVGMVWFFMAFFVIIPAYAHLRIEGYNKFAASLGIQGDDVQDVTSPNYFISRYEAFGDTYTEVMFGMLTHPDELARVMFGGDKTENLTKTFAPLAYTSLFFPALLFILIPDLTINYATTQGGIGTSEIINHRISMLIPVLFISSIYGVGFISRFITPLLGKVKVKIKGRKIHFKAAQVSVLFALIVLISSIKTTFTYENPVYLWLTQAVEKRAKLPKVFAKNELEIATKKNIEIGERFTLSALDNKDRECAQKVVNIIPADASVTGPDYLGAHLGLRETYAIFPALFNEADYVIVDVFAQKILRILDADVSLVKDIVAEMIKAEDYKLKLGCGNLFVFQRVGSHGKIDILPLQERFLYEEKTDLELFLSLTIVDYTFPPSIKRGETADAQLVYNKREEERLDDYVLFLSFINEKTGETYQMANLPSFALNQLGNWSEDRYYIEDLEIALPEFIDPGTYRIFIGMTNSIRTRSIYLGDFEVL